MTPKPPPDRLTADLPPLDTLRDWLTGDHATPAAYRMGFVTAEQMLALLDRLEAAERDRDRLRRKIRPCARCGQREVVGRHGELVCCDRCGVEVGQELLAEAYRVDLEETT